MEQSEEDTPSFAAKTSVAKSPAKKNPIAVGKKPRKQVAAAPRPDVKAKDLPDSNDSEDYDFTIFMKESYWKPVVAMKRNIKRLSKELKQEQKALTMHF